MIDTRKVTHAPSRVGSWALAAMMVSTENKSACHNCGATCSELMVVRAGMHQIFLAHSEK